MHAANGWKWICSGFLRWLRPQAAALLLIATAASAQPTQPLVAAASDLKFALEQIAAAFKRDSGQSVRLVFGSSGVFAMQIRQGAPFQLYLSADEAYVQALHAEGFTRDAGALYAIGRIVLMAPSGSPLAVDPGLKGLAERLRAGQVRRFAIANPAHAPYGQRAEEALRHAGLWDLVQPRLVYGENVSQAAQFATSGSADGGIIALSLARAPQMAGAGRYAVIPAEFHQPLRQRIVLLRNADAAAQRFYDYLQQPAARTIMRSYGFALPGEPG